MNTAPTPAGPELRDAHPAAAVFVVLADAVPVELHLHAPVLIGPNLFAGFAHDDSRLRAADHGLGGELRGPILRVALDGGDVAAHPHVVRAVRVFSLAQVVLNHAVGRDDQVLAVLIVQREA